jgi:YD repeat-containing protein
MQAKIFRFISGLTYRANPAFLKESRDKTDIALVGGGRALIHGVHRLVRMGPSYFYIPYCRRCIVKKICSFGLGLMMMSMLLVGCGGGGDNAPAPIKPSATDFPFGVSSILNSMDERILSAEFVYDAAGRVVEVHMTAERLRSQDGRIHEMVTVVYTLDPKIVVIEVPEMMEMMEMFREGDMEEVAPQARSSLFDIPYFINDLPGAVIQVALHMYGYEPRPFEPLHHHSKAVQVPEELVLLGTVLLTFDHDATGRLFKVAFEQESARGYASRVSTGTYDATGRLIRKMTLMQIDEGNTGWVAENHAIETKYTYNAAGELIKKVVDDFDEPVLEVTTFAYNEDGRLTESIFQRVDKRDQLLLSKTVTRNTYDEIGNLIEEAIIQYSTDPDGNLFQSLHRVSRYRYDERHRILEQIRRYYSAEDPPILTQSYIFSYAYGAFGLTDYTFDVRDSGGLSAADAYRYSYNEQGQLTEKRHRDFDAERFHVETFGYDTGGRIVSKKNATHFVVDDEPGSETDSYTITFKYDEKGRLAEWVFEEFEVEKTKTVFELIYDANERYATVVIQDFDWDPTAADGAGAYVEVDTPRSISISFLSGAPRGTMAFGVAPPEFEMILSKDFERVRIYVDVPALFSLVGHTSDLHWFIVR